MANEAGEPIRVAIIEEAAGGAEKRDKNHIPDPALKKDT